MNLEKQLLGTPWLLEVMELGKSQSIGDSVDTLMDTVNRWCADYRLDDDVSILGIEIAS